MSVLTELTPGQALIHSIVRDNIVQYKFKLYSGEEGDISLSTITSLGLNVGALPAVITTEQLISVLYGNTVEFSKVLVNLMQKADTDFVKKAIQTRVSIDKFREFIAKVPLTESYNNALANKADLEYVNTALSGKVDRGQVYTIDKIHEVLLQFLGARAVYDIAERDALEYGMYPFVWVLDASDDSDPNVMNPALYKWNVNHWVYLGTVGNFISCEGGSGNVDLSNYYTISEVDALINQLVPDINGAADNGKVITVALESVNGQPVYKYVLSNVPTFDSSALEEQISLTNERVNQLGVDVAANASQIESNRTDISNLTQSVSGIHDTLEAHEAFIANNASEIRYETEARQSADIALSAEISEVADVVVEFKTQTNATLTSHNTRLSTAESNISGLNQTVQQHGTQLSQHNTSIVSHTEQLNDHNTSLSSHEQTLQSHNTRITALENNQGSASDTDISRLETMIQEEASTRQTRDNELETVMLGSVATLTAYVDDVSEQCDSNRDTLTDHADRIALLEQSSGSSNIDLTPITNRLTAVEGRLTTVEDTLGIVDSEVTNILVGEFGQEV